MALSSEMRNLAQNLLEDYGFRIEAVADLRSNVRQELGDLHAAHQAMTAEQQQRLNAHMQVLRRQVAEAGRATAAFLNEMDAAHQAMTIEKQQQLNEHMVSLRRRVPTSR
jgi:DNA-binding transcriptional MerR regulator